MSSLLREQKFIGISVFVIFLVSIGFTLFFRNDSETIDSSTMDRAFLNGEVAYKSRKFKKALHDYDVFLKLAIHRPHQDSRVIRAVGHIGRIYLSILHEPKQAVRLLGRFVNHPGLNEAENEELHEWIAVADQRLKYSEHPNEISNPQVLYTQGKRHFEQAVGKVNIKSSTAQKHFEIAESYFLRLIQEFEDFRGIAEVYYMVGVIEKHILTQQKWVEHFYLKEAIRAAPHTPLARKAYQFLYQEIHKENSKSGRDMTPESIERSLKGLKALADVSVDSKPEK